MGNYEGQQVCLHLFAKGLPEYEQKIIEATAKISHSRMLAVYLVDEGNAKSAEVIIVDGGNAHSLAWAAENQSWLAQKTVLWIDAPAKVAGHVTLKRPVLWVNLPIVLSRILDDIEIAKATRSLTADRVKKNKVQEQVKSDVNIKARILVCDDSEVVRTHLSVLLEDRGYATTTVENGEAAIEAVKNQLFDCVLMDVLMPGMDGYRTCREILRKGLGQRSTPVIMLTSKTSPFDKIRGKMSGCSAYLTKPVTVSDLLRTLERYTRDK